MFRRPFLFSPRTSRKRSGEKHSSMEDRLSRSRQSFHVEPLHCLTLKALPTRWADGVAKSATNRPTDPPSSSANGAEDVARKTPDYIVMLICCIASQCRQVQVGTAASCAASPANTPMQTGSGDESAAKSHWSFFSSSPSSNSAAFQ